jgi:hypothetical protein
MKNANMEEIRSAIAGMSPEMIADALALVLSEKDAPNVAVAGTDKPELANFSQAISYLKNNYDFHELEYFITEADIVYVETGDRRIILTDRMNKISGTEEGRKGENHSKSTHPEYSPGGFIQESDATKRSGPDENGGRFSHLEI